MGNTPARFERHISAMNGTQSREGSEFIITTHNYYRFNIDVLFSFTYTHTHTNRGLFPDLSIQSVNFRIECIFSLSLSLFFSLGIGTRQHPFGEINEITEAGPTASKDGQILAVQRGDSDHVDVVLHPGGSLAGLYLVRNRREGEIEKRQRLGPR